MPFKKAVSSLESISLRLCGIVCKYKKTFYVTSLREVCIFFAEESDVPAALPPECSTSKEEVKYIGTQWITTTGQPCLPWVYATRIMDSLSGQPFEDGSAVAALNYCRNPTNDPKGPFCYIHDEATHLTRKEYCHPRKCTASGNRMCDLKVRFKVSWNRKYPRKLWEREYLYHIQSLPQSII
jgi:hypothetical protein